MSDIPCPNGDGNELRHPDAMFCMPCVRRLPQSLRRAIFRVNHDPGLTPGDETSSARQAVFDRAERWFVNHPAGAAPRRRTAQQPKATLRYSRGTR